MKKVIYGLGLLISMLLGIIFFALHNDLIIIRYPGESTPTNKHPLTKELMRFTYWKETSRCYEWRSIIIDKDMMITAQRIINTYWAIIEDNGLLPVHITAQAVAHDRSLQTLICSLSNHPYNSEKSILNAFLMIEGLLLTLRELMPQFQKILFLVDHKHITHSLLQFSRPWPLEGFSSIAQLAEHHTQSKYTIPTKSVRENLIIFINPTGTAYQPGRTIGDSFERGIAINCAQALKNELHIRFPSARVIVNHLRDESRDPFQSINQAHRLNAHLYIHLSFYQTQQSTPELILTTFRWHPTTDLWKREQQPFSFVPLHEAHFSAVTQSDTIAKTMLHYAITTRPYALTALAYLPIPHAPLQGLSIPAVGIEIGLQSNKQLHDIAPAIADLIIKGCELLK